jgi:hypothetical protein
MGAGGIRGNASVACAPRATTADALTAAWMRGIGVRARFFSMRH